MGSIVGIIVVLGSFAAMGTAALEYYEYRKRKGVTLKNEDRGVKDGGESGVIHDKIDVFLCSVGLHRWSDSVEDGVEWCSRFCQKRRCVDECQYETVHRDDACSIEQCTRCGDTIKYGDH